MKESAEAGVRVGTDVSAAKPHVSVWQQRLRGSTAALRSFWAGSTEGS